MSVIVWAGHAMSRLLHNDAPIGRASRRGLIYGVLAISCTAYAYLPRTMKLAEPDARVTAMTAFRDYAPKDARPISDIPNLVPEAISCHPSGTTSGPSSGAACDTPAQRETKKQLMRQWLEDSRRPGGASVYMDRGAHKTRKAVWRAYALNPHIMFAQFKPRAPGWVHVLQAHLAAKTRAFPKGRPGLTRSRFFRDITYAREYTGSSGI